MTAPIKVKLQGILDDEESLILFSSLGSVFKLGGVLKEKGLTLTIFVDVLDEFDLLSAITNPKENPIIIDIKRISDTGEEK